MTRRLLIVVLIVVLFALNLFVGAVSIPWTDTLTVLTGGSVDNAAWTYIILCSRLPSAVTALLCGAALAAAGLMLQTTFRNPLAGPGIFGVSSGASLGVALVLLLPAARLSLPALGLSLLTLVGAFVGAIAVLVVILAFAGVVRSNVMLLIIGIMTGYVASSAISLLNFFATDRGVHSYIIWGLGSFGGVTTERLPFFVVVCVLGLLAALLLVKPLNALLLGERYARNLGVNIRAVRMILLAVTGLLTAVTTAYCGPVAFIGLAVPHVARLLLATDDHRRLLPATMLCGSAAALLCNLLCVLPGDGGLLPLNAVTPLLGAPVIVYIIAAKNRS